MTKIITHTKLVVINRLTNWFPSLAVNLNIDGIRNSGSISTSNVQYLFWEQIRLQIENGNRTPRSILIEAVRCEPPFRMFTPRPTVDLILWDLVFLSHVDNPAMEFNSKLESLKCGPPSFEMLGHSSEVNPNPLSFVEAVIKCSDMAKKLMKSKKFRTLWHGTTGAAGGLMMKQYDIIQSTGPHDFGPGIYTFSDALLAASFGLDRSFYFSRNVPNRNNSNVMLVCIILSEDFFTENIIEVENTELSSDEISKLQFRLLEVYSKDENYIDQLTLWQKFVKYCRVMKSTPSTTMETPIFCGTLHDCAKTEETDTCSPPEKDRDNWTQYCIQIDNGFNIPDVKILFFELQAIGGNGFYSCINDANPYEKALLDKWYEICRNS
jgi:hypothetical protein